VSTYSILTRTSSTLLHIFCTKKRNKQNGQQQKTEDASLISPHILFSTKHNPL